MAHFEKKIGQTFQKLSLSSQLGPNLKKADGLLMRPHVVRIRSLGEHDPMVSILAVLAQIMVLGVNSDRFRKKMQILSEFLFMINFQFGQFTDWTHKIVIAPGEYKWD